jgi:cytochrome d ubiquinol oxidase subunit II
VTFLQLLPLLFILAGLILYTVLAGADLGTGLWQLTTRDHDLRSRVYESIGPVWEANHVWLIFVLTVLWTSYPGVFAAVCITLVVPLFLAAIGLILRGTAYALHGASNGPDDHREIDAVFGLSSVFTPFALGAALGGIASGRVPPSGDGDQWTSWLNPTSVLVGTLAVVLGAYLAAVQLAADSVRVGDNGAAVAFRRRALASGVVAGAVAVGGLVVVHADAPRLFDGLTSGAGLACANVSVLLGLGALALVWWHRLEVARFAAAAAIATLVAGWALAQRPDMLPGLTVAEAAAPESTLIAVVVAVVAGGIVVFPALGLLFGLVLRGRLDRPRPAPDGGGRSARPVRAGLLGRTALACFVAGAGLTLFGPGPALLSVGIVLLFAAALLGFLAAVPRAGEPGAAEPERTR